ncbi:MAG: hypothetical protein R3345_00075 [Fulvivirga sp.]|nr:hypothetical protein [Fulvivirga sp.]
MGKISVIISLFLWLQGLLVYSQQMKFYPNQGIFMAQMTCLEADSDSSVWIGTSKDGLKNFNGSKLVKFDRQNSPLGPLIRDIFIDSLDNIWVAFYAYDGENKIGRYDGSTWKIFTIDDIKNNTFSQLKGNKRGTIFAIGSGISVYDNQNWSSLDSPVEFAESISFNKDDLLTVASSEAIWMFNKNEWTEIKQNRPADHKSRIKIIKWHEDILIIGYNKFGGGGFSVLMEGQWKHFNNSNTDMPATGIHNIETDDAGNIWLAGDGGIILFNEEVLKIIPIRKDDRQAYIVDISLQSESLWIASNLGLIKMNTSGLTK